MEQFFSPKMVPLGKEALGMSNVVVHKIDGPKFAFLPPAPTNAYTHYDKVMVDKMKDIFKKVN
jgi:hypothetical protein